MSTTTNTDPTPSPDSWEAYRGVGDPEQRFSLWRLCPCPDCVDALTGRSTGHSNDNARVRCVTCRGEGKTLELVATAPTPSAVGVAIVQLGLEGEWAECPIGVMDNEGETGHKWLVRPWLPSPRNASDAGRVLRQRRDIQS